MIHHTAHRFVGLMSLAAGCTLMCAAAAQADTVLYSNGFETDVSDWTANRVASGTGGITSANGGFHAVNTGGSFSRWGGYNYGAGNAVATVFREYTTSVSIYLNTAGGAANDTRFDYSSAINNAGGTHLRDFIFTGGFYNDTDSSPQSGTNRFVFSASNNSPGNPRGGVDPVSISSSGWYTFVHHFYDNAGVLAVDMSILDSSSTSLASWTRSSPSDLIGSVGGNRYGWFVTDGFGGLAFDDASLSVATIVPLPAAGWAGLSTLAAVAGLGFARNRRNRAI